MHNRWVSRRESLFNVPLRLDESNNRGDFLSSLRKFGDHLVMAVDKSTQPPDSFYASSFFSHHFCSKQMLQHVLLVPLSGRAFNLLAAAGGIPFRVSSWRKPCSMALPLLGSCSNESMHLAKN